MKVETKQLENTVEVIGVGFYFSSKYMFSLQSLGSSLVIRAAVSLHFLLANIRF